MTPTAEDGPQAVDAPLAFLDAKEGDILGAEVAIRPGFGKSGVLIRLAVNCYELEVQDQRKPTLFHQYELRLEGPQKRQLSRNINRHAFTCLQAAWPIFASPGVAFDGGRIVISPLPLLGQPPSGVRSPPIEAEAAYPFGFESLKLPSATEKWIFALKPANVRPQLGPNGEPRNSFSLGQIHGLYGENRGKDDLDTAFATIQALNIVLKHSTAMRFPSTRRAYFPHYSSDPRARNPLACEVDGGLTLRKGFSSAIRAGIRPRTDPDPVRFLLNLDTALGVFYSTPEPKMARSNLPDLCARRLRLPPGPGALQQLGSLNDTAFRELGQFLRKLKVDIRRSPADPGVTRTIKSLTRQSAERLTFDDDDGRKVSIAEYFWRKYNVRLQYPSLPCIVINAKGHAIPMELCNVRKDQRYNLRLTGDQTSAALKIAASPPVDRFRQIQEARDNGSEENRMLRAYSLMASARLLEIHGRVLPSPQVVYNKPVDVMPQTLSWNMVKARTAVGLPSQIASWGVLNLSRLSQHQVTDFLFAFRNKLGNLGISTPPNPPPVVDARPPRTGSNVEAQAALVNHLKATGKAAQSTYSIGPTLIIVITQDKLDNVLYRAIKVAGDAMSHLKVTTQCLSAAKLSRPDDQYLSNVGLKVNLKLGGLNQRLQGVSILEQKVPIMIVGADVSHGPAGGLLKPSVAALVASMDQYCMSYAATARVQPLLEPAQEGGNAMRQEPIVEMKSMMLEMLGRWSARWPTAGLPRRIIFYRDGVSDGEFASCLRLEVPQVEEAIREAHIKVPSVKEKIRLTYIIGNKRHNIRYIPAPGERNRDKAGNCPAGTVVDTDIVSPQLFDFYSIPHSAIKGTSRPGRYIVLRDENAFGADALQELTTQLCCGFQRATRAVGTVTPSYYADIFAARARMWVTTDDDGDGRTTTTDTVTVEDIRRDQEAFERAVGEKLESVRHLGDRMWWL